MRILLVEDSQRLARSIRAGLRRLGHGVDVVHDGARGLSYARSNPYDLLILDVMLPGKSGYDILRELREEAGTAELPVLMLTARGQTRDREMAERAGVSAFMTKPFSNQEILVAIQTLVA